VNRDEVKGLLAFASSIDPKMPRPDPAVVAGWTLVLGQVPADPGARAVHAYYRSERYLVSREPVSPADIVQWWNARRRPTDSERSGGSAATRRELPRAEFDPEVGRAGMDRCMAALAARKGLDPDAAQGEASWRRSVMAERCEHCGARPGQRCTGSWLGGKPLTRQLAHDKRMQAAAARMGISRD
jgi:hypothetical protein